MSYVGIGTSDPNHPLEVEGQVFISNVEQGSATNLVPFEVHSDYTGITGDILEGARQFRLRVTPSATTTSNVNMDMGIEPTSGSYFYISNPVVDTALGSNTALRIVQAGHVEIGSNLSVSGNVVATGSLTGASLTVTGDVQGASASLGAIDGASLSVSGAVQGSSASLGAIDGSSLSVSGDVTCATGTIADYIVHAGDTDTYFGFVNADDIVFNTSGSERMRINNAGNVGINTTNPGTTLDVNGTIHGTSISSTGVINGASATVSGQVEANGTITTSNKFVHSTGATNNSSYLDESPGLTTDHYVYTRAIVNENQVGSSPSAIVFGNGATYGDDEISLVTDGVTRMYFETGGNVGVGTNNPNTTFDVNGTIRGQTVTATDSLLAGGATTSASLVTRGTANTALVIERSSIAWTTTMGMTNGTGHLQVVNNSNGVQLNKDATSWSAISDERFKKNITILENNLDVISNIRCVSFNYKHEDDSMQKRIGFIAQDWLKVLPEIVDSNGADEEDGSEEKYLLRSVDAIPVLCGAIQELVARVAALENR
jgi:hypothetical protein